MMATGSKAARRPSGSRKHCLLQAGQEHRRNSAKLTTGKYDMRVLREISHTEELALQELVEMFQVESDDSLPVNFDLHEIMDLEEGNRRPFLFDMLQACPSERVPGFVDKYLERIKGLNPYLS